MPVYNGAGYIGRSLPPLLRMLQRGEVIEVIVVDDTSTDDTPRLAAEMGARVIQSEECLGPGGARNRAAREAQGDLLWFVDADVVVHEDAVKRLIAGFAEPDVVAVFGSYDDRPPQKNFLSLYKNLLHHYHHQHGEREASTFWTGCGAVRKEAFFKVSGFDIKFYSIEDIELGCRLRANGGRILLLPGLQCTHLKEWRFLNLMYTEIFLRAIPWARLMLKRAGIVNDLNVARGERVRALLAGLLALAVVAAALGILPWWSLLVVLAMTAVVNLDLLKLFSRRRGPLFALGGLLFHQFYYLYSGAAFGWAWLEVRFNKK